MVINKTVISRNSYYYIVALACVSNLLAKVFKLGGYFDYGTLFFLVLLIENKREYLRSKIEKKNYTDFGGLV